ncbi:hypothetical protein I317_01216 [Kwoniella heveanensis CBS 569]|nr:hypothetical protein I317_01216 [Kwoniella heveanensis CBS 569]
MHRSRFRSQQPYRPFHPPREQPAQQTSINPAHTAFEASQEVEVTLSSPSNVDATVHSLGAHAVLIHHAKDQYEVDHIEHIEKRDDSAASPTPSSAQSAEDIVDNVSQPVRPRLGGIGVGAVVRHLSGSSARGGGRASTSTRAGNTPRWLTYTRGLIQPSTDSEGDHPDLQTPTVQETVMSEPVLYSSATDTSYAIPAPIPVNVRAVDRVSTSPSHAQTLVTPNQVTQRRNPLPDLTRVAPPNYVASLIASPPSSTINGRPATRPFSLAPPPYTDDDIPCPEPYNLAYPHPLTAYASPGVNPETVKASGYGELLERLVSEDLQSAVGTILYEAGFRSLESSVYLLFSFGASNGAGNGIPESLWSKLENANPTRLPVGVAGVSPFARGTMNPELAADLPPRFSQLQQAQSIEKGLLTHGMLTPASSISETDYFTPRPSERTMSTVTDFDPTPRPSPDNAPMRHAASLGQLDHHRSTTTGASHPESLYHRSGYRKQDTTDLPYPQVGSRYQSPSLPKGQHSGISPFYKTELCAMWEQMGRCKYGGQCQYAHGLEELRMPRHLQQLQPQPQPQSQPQPHAASIAPVTDDDTALEQTQDYLSDGIVYPLPHRVTSSRSYAPLLRRDQLREQSQNLQPRRASCPPLQLFPLAEAESVVASGYQHEMELTPAPIGAERPSALPLTRRSAIVQQNSVPTPPAPMWGDIDMPAFSMSSEPRQVSSIYTNSTPSSTFLRSERSTLSLSASTSSGSRFSTYINLDEYEGERADTDKVNEGHVATASGSGSGGRSSGSLASSTSLDFSTGKSIWR